MNRANFHHGSLRPENVFASFSSTWLPCLVVGDSRCRVLDGLLPTLREEAAESDASFSTREHLPHEKARAIEDRHPVLRRRTFHLLRSTHHAITFEHGVGNGLDIGQSDRSVEGKSCLAED